MFDRLDVDFLSIDTLRSRNSKLLKSKYFLTNQLFLN